MSDERQRDKHFTGNLIDEEARLFAGWNLDGGNAPASNERLTEGGAALFAPSQRAHLHMDDAGSALHTLLARPLGGVIAAHRFAAGDRTLAALHPAATAGTSSAIAMAQPLVTHSQSAFSQQMLGLGAFANLDFLHDPSGFQVPSPVVHASLSGLRQANFPSHTFDAASAGGAPSGDPSGQLWFGSEGPQDGANTSTGSSDNQIGHIDSDAGGRDVGVVNTDNLPGGSSAGYEAIGLDTAAGLYFAYDAENILHVGHITNDTETGSSSEIAQTHMVFGTGLNADEVEALAVDPIHHVVYMGLFGQSDQGTGILEIQYNPVTGALTNPYNASTGVVTDFNHMLVNDPNTGGPIVNIVGMQYDLSNHKLYYIDDTNGWPGSTGNGTTWGQRNGIYVINTQDGSGNLLSVGAGDAPTPTQLTSGAQFVAGDNTHYISGFVVDDATQQIYFTVNNNLNPNNAAQESTTIYRMSINGGAATAMSLPGGVSLHFSSYFDEGSNAMALDANTQQLYFADNYNSKIIRVQLSGDGLSFASGTNSFMVLDSNNIVLDNGNETNGVSNVGDLYFDNLPTLNSASHTLGGTSTEALQGGSALTTLTGAAITITDPDGAELGFATVKIANAQAGDVLAASTAGTSITASYNATTHTLTLSGEDTYAHYVQVMNAVTYQDGGTDNSTGSHPTRSLTWTVSDGVTIANPTATDPNVAFTTLVINRAPTLGADSYTAQEGGVASGTAGTGGTGVLGNDNDKDGDSISVVALNGSSGNLNSLGFMGTYGHFDLLSDGSYQYTADRTANIDNAAVGSHPTDSFTYTVSDGINGTTTQTVTFTINRAPTAAGDVNSIVESATTSSTNVLANDSDKDGDTVTVTKVGGSAVAAGGAGTTFAGTYGHLTMHQDGTYTYAADNTAAIDGAATGSHLTDTFVYTDDDGHGSSSATASLVITLDRAPTDVADTAAAVEAASGTGNVLTNDSDRDGDSLVVSAVNGSGAGVNNSVAGTYGHITIHTDGSYTYNADNTAAIDSAATGSHLTDTFSYTASDGHGGTTTTNLVVTLDRAPTLGADSYNLAEGGTASGTSGQAGTGLFANDSDRDGDSILITQLNGNSIGDSISNVAGAYGHLSLTSTGQFSYVADNTSAIDSAPTGSHPTDSFTYTASDGHGGLTTQTVSFVIDRPGIAQADSISTTESSTVTASTNATGLLGNDSDPDTNSNAGLSITSATVNGNAVTFGTQATFADGSTIVINSDGTYTYDPNHAWDFLPAAASGAPSTGTETFQYTINGGSTVNVTITINGQDSNDTLQGTAGSDTYNGGAGDDTFKMQDGGADNVTGGSGNDGFFFGASLTGADAIDGGTGADKISITGDYTGGNALVLTATSFTSVEQLITHAGGSYAITTADSNVASGATLQVNGSDMGAGDALTFDGSAETDGHFSFIAGSGNDALTGGAQSDTFNLVRGGTDTAHGGGGNDTFILGSTLTAADTIDGGTGADALNLAGEYSGGTALVLGASTITNIGQINFAAGDNYTITTNDGNVGAGQTLTVNGSLLGAGDVLTFNGGAETDGVFHFADGAANDTLTGGAGNDVFNMFKGGNDTVHGGGGNDYFNFAGTFGAGDVVDGGAGTDTLVLNGDYSAGLTLGSTTIQSVEILSLTDGNSYSLTLNGLDVGATATLTLSGQNLTGSNAVTFDGSAVTNGGRFVLNGGAGGDTLIGGGANDTIKAGNGANTLTGGGGQDTMTGGTGVDTYHYAAPGESTGSGHDIITNFDFSQDIFDLSGYFLNAIDTTVTGGILSQANFDHDLQIDIGASQLAAHDAVLFNPSSGYAGHTFLVIDINGTAGYQAGQDIVIDVTGATNVGSFGLSNFTFT